MRGESLILDFPNTGVLYQSPWDAYPHVQKRSTCRGGWKQQRSKRVLSGWIVRPPPVFVMLKSNFDFSRHGWNCPLGRAGNVVPKILVSTGFRMVLWLATLSFYIHCGVNCCHTVYKYIVGLGGSRKLTDLVLWDLWAPSPAEHEDCMKFKFVVMVAFWMQASKKTYFAKWNHPQHNAVVKRKVKGRGVTNTPRWRAQNDVHAWNTSKTKSKKYIPGSEKKESQHKRAMLSILTVFITSTWQKWVWFDRTRSRSRGHGLFFPSFDDPCSSENQQI